MKKKLLIIFIILVLLGSIGIIYLNNVILPIKIKSLIVRALSEQTQKKVTLESLKFSIFKGLVLRNLVILDGQKAIVSLKEASCIFLIPPIFQRKIIIPFISLKSPEIFLQRRKDSTFNLQDLFSKISPQPVRQAFGVFVYQVKLSDASIHFQDETFAIPFSKNIENINASLNLALPASIKFKLKAEIPGNPLVNIDAAGEFKVPKQQLLVGLSIENLSPREFRAYYQDLGIDINAGLIDCLIDLEFKEGVLDLSLAAKNKNLNISQDNMRASLNCDIKAELKYNLTDKQLKFSGKASIADSGISGLEFVDAIKDISGEVAFSNAGISSDKLSANVLGIPLVARINLTDFSNPLLNIDATSSLSLPTLQGLLKDKFKVVIPGDLKGEANLSLNLQTKIPATETPEANGYLDILNAILKLENLGSPIEDINGRIEFSPGQLRWAKLSFKYLGVPYTTQGTLEDFQSPAVQLNLSSPNLSLDSVFAISNNLFKFSKISGQYLNSEFDLTGNINTLSAPKLDANITGQLNIDLEDLKGLLNKFKDQLEQIKPSGLVGVKFSLNGNINDIKSCEILARLSAPLLSAWGLAAQDCSLTYNQAAGLADIPDIYLSLYDGVIKAAAKMNLASDNLPFWISADIQGVKLERLKLDTAIKEKDIAGAVNAQVKINGFSNDLSKLSGVGTVNITEGKLWQLNLFKGLGSLLFSRDFSDIVFNEGSCGFTIQDKYIFTDDLKLKSNITNLSGSVKVGFDGSIDTALNVDILDEAAPLTGTLKDIATTILGQGNRFGVIRITGTLKEPKYKFQPAVVDIINSIKNAIFGN